MRKRAIPGPQRRIPTQRVSSEAQEFWLCPKNTGEAADHWWCMHVSPNKMRALEGRARFLCFCTPQPWYRVGHSGKIC